jgi:TPR repeat protein
MSCNVNAQNIGLADNYFNDQNFVNARLEYLRAANMGNVRAYYRLADIYLHGLGQNKNEITAILWLSLAAEHDYRESNKILEKLLSKFNETQLVLIEKASATFIKSRGKAYIANLYAPKIQKTLLPNKISLEKYEGLDIDSSIIDDNFDDFNEGFDTEFDFDSDLASDADYLSEQQDFKESYYLVVEYDIAPDGSVRNIETIQFLGHGEQKKAVFALASYDFTPPIFNEQQVFKSQRAYLGAASFDNRRFKETHKTVYSQIKRQVAKYKNGKLPMDKYQYAKALMNFPFLPREKGQVEKLLKTAIDADIGMAKLEYGLKLYREQTDIKTAIHWITEAAKQGEPEAEYRLARLNLESPWVKYDENKAMVWFESAIEKQHLHAIRKYAELLLFAQNAQLHDAEQAYKNLITIEAKQEENPQYYYLLSWAAKLSSKVEYHVAVMHLKQAIHLAHFYNWPTESWDNLLKKWTSGGSVTITDT